MKKRNISRLIIFSFCLSFAVSACHTADEITNPSDFTRTIRKAKRQHTPLVMYSGIDTFLVRHVVVERNRRDMTVQLYKTGTIQPVAATTLPESKKKVLLYMRDSASYLLEEPHTIPMDRISRIHIID